LTAAARGALSKSVGTEKRRFDRTKKPFLVPCLTDRLSQLANVTVTIALEGKTCRDLVSAPDR
jgi:hypothetical protein